MPFEASDIRNPKRVLARREAAAGVTSEYPPEDDASAQQSAGYQKFFRAPATPEEKAKQAAARADALRRRGY